MVTQTQPKESPDMLANRLMREGKAEQLEKELSQYDPKALSEKDRAAYYHLLGITAYRRNDHKEAHRRFEVGLKECPDSHEIRFSLGQECEVLGRTEEMFRLFDDCKFPNLPSQYVLAMARYAYLWDRPDKGLAFLNPILEAYFKLKIADDHFVYVRGLPFFEQTWRYVVAFSWLQKDFTEATSLLNRAKRELSEYDFSQMEEFYSCLISSDFAPYIARLQSHTANQNLGDAFEGYRLTQTAALSAFMATNCTEALKILSSVSLKGNVFPWLKDILLVHKARTYWKYGDMTNEIPMRRKFMEQQKLLFEPDHAINFMCIDYQESLKKDYQQMRLNPQ